ncbi:iron-containing alcohol dehydrogenase [Anaerostipes butyraticus]|uniref:1,3-propanediol dehydrogenase n=1 Tax=Anaerostipes butyraticus TaxID=645466 RepID=A0A916VFE2_9FIRM|nr:iron-containing alcohol dehydrogenase [Anaerostipes butyraticus]GFO86692.1 1,3-propanediol dehydrogenase [Anaerostipes butyraticus]
MAEQFFIPKKIITGEDALAAAGDRIANMGKKALIVCGPNVRKMAAAEKVMEELEKRETAYAVYSDITGEPTDRMIDNGARVYLEEACDFLIGIGGGSPLDAMKAIALKAVCGGEMADYMGVSVEAKLPPMAAVPTTAGTGSEATQFTIITDTKNDVKMLLKGESFMPDLAVVDPEFSVSAPRGVTASTGLDALTHAVEAYTSRKAQPLTDIFAVSAVRRIFQNLPEAYENGSSRNARKEMALAALEAGIAFNNASVTIVHGMSRPIGALFHVPHGTSNAILLHPCLKYVMDGAVERFAVLGREIKAAGSQDDDKSAAEKFIEEVRKLCRKCGIGSPNCYGIEKEAFLEAVPKMAEDAVASGSPANTRKKIQKEDIIKIYQSLW